MDKKERKAREDEIARMVTEFCNEKIDAEYASLCKKWYVNLDAREAILLNVDGWKYGQLL